VLVKDIPISANEIRTIIRIGASSANKAVPYGTNISEAELAVLIPRLG
jgi:hypothetical protein